MSTWKKVCMINERRKVTMAIKLADKVSFIRKYILPKSNDVLYLTLTISSVLPLLICYLVYPKVMNKLPVYSDFIAGATTWTGYNKNGDLTLFYFYLIIYLLLLVLTPLLLNYVFHKKDLVKNNKEDYYKYDHAQFFLLSFFIFCSTTFFLNKVLPWNLLLVLIFFFLVFYYLSRTIKTDMSTIFSKVCLLSTFTYFIVIAGFIALDLLVKRTSSAFPLIRNYIFVAIMLAVLYMSWSISKGIIKEQFIDNILMLSQALLPVLFLLFYKFQYTYRGDIVAQYDSQKLKYTCLFVAILMLIYNIYILYRKYRKGLENKQILITSLISITAFTAFNIPGGSFLSDFFHNGEQTAPMQQLFQFGSIPYFDYLPIHGLMDYFNQSVNYIFFNGQYGTYAAACSIANVLKAIILCLIIRNFTKGEIFPFVLSVLCATTNIFTDRMFGVFIMMVVLNSEKTRKNPLMILWWWVFASIFAIAWNPSLGGSVAISFIPLVFYSFVSKDGRISLSQLAGKKYRNKIIIYWIPLILIGVLFIPMFFKIVEYTLDNAASTLYANGTSATYAIIQGASKFFNNQIANSGLTLLILPLGFTAVIAFLLIILYYYRESDIAVILTMLQIIILTAMVASYTFGRADSNLNRAGNAVIVISTAIITAIGSQIVTKKRYGKAIIIIPIIMGISFSGSIGTLFDQHKKIYTYSEIESDFIQFDGAVANINNLGVVYVEQKMVDRLINTNIVLNGEESFLDLTNSIALDAILGKKTPVPYSSIYNVYSQPLHYKYLNSISASPPDVVLIYPNIVHDSYSAAFRAYPVYRWLIQRGYEPFKYNDIVFLLSKNSSKRSLYEKADFEFTSIMHKRDLGYLPILWGSEEIISRRVINSNIVLNGMRTNQIEEINENVCITGNDSFIVYQLDTPISGMENDFIRVSINSEYDLKDESSFQIFWAAEGESFTEEKSFLFNGDSGDLLIPMGTSPYWSLSSNIKNIRFDFPASMESKHVPSVEIGIYKSLN